MEFLFTKDPEAPDTGNGTQDPTRTRVLGIENSIQSKGRLGGRQDEDQGGGERTHATNFIFICIFRLTTSRGSWQNRAR